MRLLAYWFVFKRIIRTTESQLILCIIGLFLFFIGLANASQLSGTGYFNRLYPALDNPSLLSSTHNILFQFYYINLYNFIESIKLYLINAWYINDLQGIAGMSFNYPIVNYFLLFLVLFVNLRIYRSIHNA